MNRVVPIAMLVVGGLCLPGGDVATAQLERATTPTCRVSQLTLAEGPSISPATGQNPLALRLMNRSRQACVLYGYPTIAFTDERGAIPLAIAHGGDQMVTARRPARVVVASGRSGFVLVNKYRCDLGDFRVARTVRLGLPGVGASRLSLPLRSYPLLAYCGKGDPGSIVVTSPFEATLAGTLRR